MDPRERAPAAPASARDRATEACVAFAIRAFRPRGPSSVNPRLARALEQAHVPFLPDAFVALTRFITVAAAACGLVLAALVQTGAGVPGPAGLVLLVGAPVALAGLAYALMTVYPAYRAGERRRAIDRDIPFAVNHVAAMTAAGLVPTAVFRELAREPLYGEVSREMAWLTRDVELLGCDLLTAFDRALERAPSDRLKDFLQGAKATLLAGGDLKAYFQSKAAQYMTENRHMQKTFLASLGVLAESYVTVAIAAPLFLIVLFSMMIVIGRSAAATLSFLVLLVFALLPAAHLLFSWTVSGMSPEA